MAPAKTLVEAERDMIDYLKELGVYVDLFEDYKTKVAAQ